MTQQQCQTEGDPHSLLSPLSDALKMFCPTVDAFKLKVSGLMSSRDSP